MKTRILPMCIWAPITILLLLTSCKQEEEPGRHSWGYEAMKWNLEASTAGVADIDLENKGVKVIEVTPPGGTLELECLNADQIVMFRCLPIEGVYTPITDEPLTTYSGEYFDITVRNNRYLRCEFKDIPQEYSGTICMVQLEGMSVMDAFRFVVNPE